MNNYITFKFRLHQIKKCAILLDSLLGKIFLNNSENWAEFPQMYADCWEMLLS